MSEGEYGEAALRLFLANRTHAFIFEQAVADTTRAYAHCPERLWQWGGRSEVRRMTADDLSSVALQLHGELEEHGLWEFALRYTPLTATQRLICQQRALTGNALPQRAS